MKNLILSIRKFLFADTCVCCENRPDNKLHYLCRGCFNIILKEKSINKIENTYYILPYRSLFRKLLLEYKGNSILPLSHIISEIISDDFFNIIYNFWSFFISSYPNTGKYVMRRRKYLSAQRILNPLYVPHWESASLFSFQPRTVK